MTKPAAIFVALCIVTIAASLAVIGTAGFGLSPLDAAILSIGTLAVLGLIHAALTWTRGTGASSPDEDVVSGLTMQRIVALETRLARLEVTTRERARAAVDPIAGEVAELGQLVSQLAEQVEIHDNALRDLGEGVAVLPAEKPKPAPLVRATFHAAPLQVSWQPVSETDAKSPVAPAPETQAEPAPESAPQPEPAPASRRRPTAGVTRQDLMELRASLEEGRVEIHLQPVVALPQRRVLFYEADARLRGEDERVLAPHDFLPLARAAGLVPSIDRYVIERGLQIADRLRARGRELGLFARISAETLANDDVFARLVSLLDARKEHAGQLILCVGQSALGSMGAIERETLASLAERGYRFMLDQVDDLSLDPRALHGAGFRFVKAAAADLLTENPPAHLEIHPADIPGFLKRHGLTLIASGVEAESTVADLLDLDITHAQGGVFGAARPVRAEIFAEASRAPAAAGQGRAAVSTAVRPETARAAGRPAMPSSTGFMRRI